MNMDYQVGIVGAGFGGIIAGINLIKSGRSSFVIFERAGEVGGVWRDNIYPGCSCDVRSTLYSIKSEPNPNWSQTYSPQNEIFQYLKNIVKKYGVEKHIQYGTDIVEMKFMEDGGYWLVKDQLSNILKIKTMILATGPFRLPRMPAISGRELFKGKSFHSASWDTNINLSGLNAAVIGTGASSVQIVPNIVAHVKQLYVFQRSPGWILPRWNSKNSLLLQRLYSSFPFFQRLNRHAIYWILETIGLSFLGHDRMNKAITRFAANRIKKEVKDPGLVKKLTPEYTFGCKRVLVSDDYYTTFTKPNVTLITEGISKITEDKIYTSDGTVYSVDAIVYATGFSVPDVEEYIKIYGRYGQELTDEWHKHDANAYRGITVSGYPNLCFLLGPNSGLFHSSAIHIMESQMSYVLQYLLKLEQTGMSGFIDVKAEAQKKYNQKLEQELKNTIWGVGCNSWFINKNGKNVILYPHLTAHYRKQTKKLNPDDYLFYNGVTENTKAIHTSA